MRQLAIIAIAAVVVSALLTGPSLSQTKPDPATPKTKVADGTIVDEFGRPEKTRSELEFGDYLTVIALGLALLIGAGVIALANRWLRKSREEEISANDQLSEFRRLKAEGKLSDEEFQRIRGVLGPKIRSEVGLGTKEQAAPSPPKSEPTGEPQSDLVDESNDTIADSDNDGSQTTQDEDASPTG